MINKYEKILEELLKSNDANIDYYADSELGYFQVNYLDSEGNKFQIQFELAVLESPNISYIIFEKLNKVIYEFYRDKMYQYIPKVTIAIEKMKPVRYMDNNLLSNTMVISDCLLIDDGECLLIPTSDVIFDYINDSPYIVFEVTVLNKIIKYKYYNGLSGKYHILHKIA